MTEYIIQKAVQRGHDHNSYCEDFLVTHESEHFIVGIVMDGCSNGVHSHFASSFYGKLFNLLLRYRGLLDQHGPQTHPRYVAQELMFNFMALLKKYSAELELQINELMSTVLMAVYEKSKGKLFVVACGDGYVHIEGQGYSIPNTRYPDAMINGKLVLGKDQPDYLVFDLEAMNFENADSWDRFCEWFNKRDFVEEELVTDFSISTDGIYTFKNRANDSMTDQVIPRLMDMREGFGGMRNQRHLKSKLNNIGFSKKVNGLEAINFDDISIIRVIADEVNVNVVDQNEMSTAQ